MKAQIKSDGFLGVDLPRIVRHLDLFSGIGGFALAAQMAGGIETVGFCEIDEWPQKILRQTFPDVPIHGDVKTLDPKNYGRIDLITGGYPCQPFSVAGKQRGKDDDRHLWPEVFRIIKEARPRMVLCENVGGHVNMGLDEVLSDLEAEGYSAEPIVIPACAVDAHHRRDRVWIMGYAEHDGSPTAEVGGIANEAGYHEAERQDETRQSTRASGRKNDEAMAYSERPRLEREARSECESAQLITPDVSWRGCKNRWEAEPVLGRVAHGIPDRAHRIKGLGNAIVPQVAAEILRVMMHVDSYSLPNA